MEDSISTWSEIGREFPAFCSNRRRGGINHLFCTTPEWKGDAGEKQIFHRNLHSGTFSKPSQPLVGDSSTVNTRSPELTLFWSNSHHSRSHLKMT